MSGRKFLSSVSVLQRQVRGKALQNWTRPSIDELGVPTKSWARVHERMQRRFNMQLFAGVAFFAVTVTTVANTINLNPEPKHLMK
jgi:hypothetical protein